jgi:dTMP kinase
MSGLFITFEGNEGSGKSTQIQRMATRLKREGRAVVTLREPGGTPIGEEIRHTLKHSHQNSAMTPEAELLLMNASRAQLVREVIRPALADGKIVVCDRFFDSTTAYQGYGRQLPLDRVRTIIDFAVGATRPDLTLLLLVPHELSEQRREGRRARQPNLRDRFEEADREFFDRVDRGYRKLAGEEPDRIQLIAADQDPDSVEKAIWNAVAPRLPLLAG